MTKAACSLSHNNDDIKPHSSNETREAFMPFTYLMAMGANDISKLVLPKPKRHWGEFITASRLGMIVAPRAAGKSTFTLALALSMVSHVEFLGYKSGGFRKVIILDGEMDLLTMQKRIAEQAGALGVEINNNLRFISPELFDGVLPTLSTADDQRHIDEAIGTDWHVLIIDNYSAFSEGGREDAESFVPLIRWMLAHKREGRTIILIHHTGKNGVQRGSSKHEDALDFVIALKPITDIHDGALRFVVEWKKSRHLASDKTAPFLATYAKAEDGSYVWTKGDVSDANSGIKKAKELSAQGLNQAEIAKELGVSKSTVSRRLKRD